MRIFFVLALGRSGTNFLATLLAHDRRGVVHHESYDYDHKLIWLRYCNSFGTVTERMLEERFAVMLPEDGKAEFYGEVNSYLRYEADWLRRRFDPVLVHLVRDGRDFVRSAWIRQVYTPLESDGPIVPRDDDPYASRWGEMSRFERLCWYWQHSNEFLAARVSRCVRFEKVLEDYDYFASHLLEPTGVRISEELWSREIGRPRNTSRSFGLKRSLRRLVGEAEPRVEPLPHWRQWDDRMNEQFWSICGATMERMGYRG